jgi:hypothetical protein
LTRDGLGGPNTGRRECAPGKGAAATWRLNLMHLAAVAKIARLGTINAAVQAVI